MTRLLPLLLLRDPDAFRARVRAGAVGPGGLAQLAVFTAVACAAYGAVLAGWCPDRMLEGGATAAAEPVRQALYGAAKLPLLFLGSTALVTLFNWVVSLLLGAPLRLRDVLALVLSALSLAGWILLAIAPVAAFLVASAAPETGPEETLHRVHNAVLVAHVGVLAAAGLAGTASFRGVLRALVPDGGRSVLLGAVWLASFAFVGCQLAWILRPFVGSPFYELRFLRADALDRNFYEFLFGEVLPYLFPDLIRLIP